MIEIMLNIIQIQNMFKLKVNILLRYYSRGRGVSKELPEKKKKL